MLGLRHKPTQEELNATTEFASREQLHEAVLSLGAFTVSHGADISDGLRRHNDSLRWEAQLRHLQLTDPDHLKDLALTSHDRRYLDRMRWVDADEIGQKVRQSLVPYLEEQSKDFGIAWRHEHVIDEVRLKPVGADMAEHGLMRAIRLRYTDNRDRPTAPNLQNVEIHYTFMKPKVQRNLDYWLNLSIYKGDGMGDDSEWIAGSRYVLPTNVLPSDESFEAYEAAGKGSVRTGELEQLRQLISSR